ncbi:MAG: hypothetical protein ACMUIG_01015 [Thermoplasmatota archaeon]
MNNTLRSILIMVITIVILLGIFLFVVPLTGLPEQLGSMYWIATILGSIAISYGVSWLLGKIIKPSRK